MSLLSDDQLAALAEEVAAWKRWMSDPGKTWRESVYHHGEDEVWSKLNDVLNHSAEQVIIVAEARQEIALLKDELAQAKALSRRARRRLATVKQELAELRRIIPEETPVITWEEDVGTITQEDYATWRDAIAAITSPEFTRNLTEEG